MIRSKTNSWFLLGYFVLLLNFGPSLHHAPIFGLHATHPSSSAHSSCSCGCHHHHGTSDQWELRTPIAELQTDVQANALVSAESFAKDESGCAFCKFFDEFNFVIAGLKCTDVETPLLTLASTKTASGTPSALLVLARGPPKNSLV